MSLQANAAFDWMKYKETKIIVNIIQVAWTVTVNTVMK